MSDKILYANRNLKLRITSDLLKAIKFKQMKKILLLLIFCIAFTGTSIGQEWFTSFDVAKRMALAQNKMLFVVWEDSFKTPYYVQVKDENGKSIYVDVTQNDEVNNIIWDYFIPVLMPEDEYGDLYNKAKELRGELYLSKLEDASIKIMDVNGNILNKNFSVEVFDDLPSLIKWYSFDTTFLSPFLRNYLKKENFNTTFILGSKYLDYALFSKKEMRTEIVELAGVYLKESRNYLGDLENENAFSQKLDFFEIKKLLVLNNPKKAKRLLKRIEVSEVDKINKPLLVFLNYTTFIMLKDEENVALWRDKISETNLKKASLIFKAYN